MRNVLVFLIKCRKCHLQWLFPSSSGFHFLACPPWCLSPHFRFVCKIRSIWSLLSNADRAATKVFENTSHSTTGHDFFESLAYLRFVFHETDFSWQTFLSNKMQTLWHPKFSLSCFHVPAPGITSLLSITLSQVHLSREGLSGPSYWTQTVVLQSLLKAACFCILLPGTASMFSLVLQLWEYWPLCWEWNFWCLLSSTKNWYQNLPPNSFHVLPPYKTFHLSFAVK